MKTIYDKMWDDALEKLEKGELEIDPYINYKNDLRRGITLLIKPEKNLLNSFGDFIKNVMVKEPGQYFYKPEEIHVTVLSIINCSVEFKLSRIHLPDYLTAIENSLKNIHPFNIEFKGITASPSCLLFQGFPENNNLEIIRNNLRAEFNRGELFHSIDARYKIKTAHCTAARFMEGLKDKNVFIDLLKENREKYFGNTRVSEIGLVYTDWYHKKENVKELYKFKL